jgi:SAM-dependent methyltransferase
VTPAPALPVADIIGWDVANWGQCLPFWEPWVAGFDRSSSRVLVIGDRHGGISLWLALLGFDVLCTDYEVPGDSARTLHERWRVGSRMSYSAVDAFDIHHEPNSFDVVASKSVLGGLRYRSERSLEGQRVAVEEMRRVLKPGGVFLGAENLTGTRAHAALRSVRPAGQAGWYYLRASEIRWLFEDFSACEQMAWGFVGTRWPQRFGINRMAALLDVRLSRWLPADWLYISFLRARK